MERARDEGETVISDKVRLVQETEQNVQAGFLMYLPVFRPPAPYPSAEARHAHLVGWVYAPFRMDDLMAGVLDRHFGEIGSSLELEIHDGETTDPSRLMFHSGVSEGSAGGAFHAIRTLKLFNHT